MVDAAVATDEVSFWKELNLRVSDEDSGLLVALHAAGQEGIRVYLN